MSGLGRCAEIPGAAAHRGPHCQKGEAMNAPTLVVLALVVLLVAAVVGKLIRDKRAGKHACSCGGSCGGCANQCHCHSTKK